MGQAGRRVILSHPFSGALYAFIHDQLIPERPVDTQLDHPYYRTLYGSEYRSLRALSLTMLILFDEVLLVPADTALPDRTKCERDNEYFHPDLGLRLDLETWERAHDGIYEMVEADLQDKQVRASLHRMPRHAMRQVVQDTRQLLQLAAKHNAPILCSRGRENLLQALRMRTDPHGIHDERASTKDLIAPLSDYLEVVGPVFLPSTLDELARVRSDPDVRNYSAGFSTTLLALDGGDSTTQRFRALLHLAMESEAFRTQAKGVFSTASRVLNVVGLVPGVGTVASLASMAADVASVAADRSSGAARWYEFGPSVSRALTLDRLRRATQTSPKSPRA